MSRPVFGWDAFPFDGEVWWRDDDFYVRRGLLRLRHVSVDVFGIHGAPGVAGKFGKLLDFGYGEKRFEKKRGLWVLYETVEGFTIYRSHFGTLFRLERGMALEPFTLLGRMGKTGNAKRNRCHNHINVKWRRSHVNHAPALLWALEREGRRMGRSLCEKNPATCAWCNP